MLKANRERLQAGTLERLGWLTTTHEKRPVSVLHLSHLDDLDVVKCAGSCPTCAIAVSTPEEAWPH